MKLTVMDRFQLLQVVLPKDPHYIDALIKRAIRKKVEFTVAEIEEFEIRPVGGNSTTWSKERQREIDVSFEKVELDLLRRGVDAAAIPDEALDVCTKIKEEK